MWLRNLVLGSILVFVRVLTRRRSFRQGLKVAIADVTADKLQEVGKELAKIVGDANVLVVPTDVSKIEEVVRLRDRVYEAWGEVRSSLTAAAAAAAAPAQSLSPAWHLCYS